MHCCIPTSTTDNNSSTGMIWITFNMPSAVEECCESSGKCRGNFTLSGEWSRCIGHIGCMDDNTDARRILLASPPADWRRQSGLPHFTWPSTIQQDLKHYHLMLPDAADMA